MKSKTLRITLSALSLCALWLTTISASAAPIRFSQVVQVVNAKPGRASNGNFTQLRLAGDEAAAGDDDDTKKTTAQDGRVIVETRTDIVEDDACDCAPIPAAGGGFPKYALLGLGAIPLFFLIHRRDDPTPTPTVPATPTDTPTVTPTPSNSPTPTPTGSPTPTPTLTPTPTPTGSPTPTPTLTPPETPTPPPPTPTPTPTPEPVTVLLFGTGLAGIGFAARKRLRRKEDSTEGN